MLASSDRLSTQPIVTRKWLRSLFLIVDKMSTSMHVICHKKISNTLKLFLSKIKGIVHLKSARIRFESPNCTIHVEKIVDLPVQKDNEDIVLDIVSAVKLKCTMARVRVTCTYCARGTRSETLVLLLLVVGAQCWP